MINYYYSRGAGAGRKPPFSNPLANALVILVGALVIAVSIVLGFIAFVVLGSLVLILAAVIGIRVWWLGRRQAAARRQAVRDRDAGAQARIHVIEGEYREVSRDRPDRRRP